MGIGTFTSATVPGDLIFVGLVERPRGNAVFPTTGGLGGIEAAGIGTVD